MLHDEDIFPDPKEFIPERFLKNDRELRDDLPNPERFASFGFGRRYVVPGPRLLDTQHKSSDVSGYALGDILQCQCSTSR